MDELILVESLKFTFYNAHCQLTNTSSHHLAALIRQLV